MIITDGIIVALFGIKCFYGLRYFVDIVCPPKRSKTRDGRMLNSSEKKIHVVKK